MTTAERLKEEGKREERRHMLITLLEARFPGEAIPPTVRRRIAEAPADMLMQWFQQAARASSLQDAFAKAENPHEEPGCAVVSQKLLALAGPMRM